MSIIIPYSSLAQDPFVAADYPACKLLFEFSDDDSPTTGAKDSVSGSTATLSAGTASYTCSSDGATSPAIVTATYTLPSAITVSNTEFGLFVVAATIPADGALVSHVQHTTLASGKIGFNGVDGASKFAFDDAGGVALASTRAPTSALDGSRELYGAGYIAAASLGTDQLRLIDVVGASPTATLTTESAARSLTALTLSKMYLDFAGTGAVLHFAAFFKFASVPADLLAAVAWMSEYHSVYPGWKGRS